MDRKHITSARRCSTRAALGGGKTKVGNGTSDNWTAGSWIPFNEKPNFTDYSKRPKKP
jgi:hypothetical protein